LIEVLEEVTRLGCASIYQTVIEADVTEFPGWSSPGTETQEP
jgi:hypothetical protein